MTANSILQRLQVLLFRITGPLVWFSGVAFVACGVVLGKTGDDAWGIAFAGLGLLLASAGTILTEEFNRAIKTIKHRHQQ
jgi:hypothetical protein